MIRLISIVLDVIVLVVFTLDYLKTKEYLEELNRMKHEIWKMKYEVSEMGDRLSCHNHGEEALKGYI